METIAVSGSLLLALWVQLQAIESVYVLFQSNSI